MALCSERVWDSPTAQIPPHSTAEQIMAPGDPLREVLQRGGRGCLPLGV